MAHIRYKQDYFGIVHGQTSKNDLQYFRWKRHLVHLSSFTIMQRYLLRFVHQVYINDKLHIYTQRLLVLIQDLLGPVSRELCPSHFHLEY